MASVDSAGSSEKSDSSLICGFGVRHRTNSDDSGHDLRAFQKKRSDGSSGGHGTNGHNGSTSDAGKRKSDGNRQGFEKSGREMAAFEDPDAEFARNGRDRNGGYRAERDSSRHYSNGKSNGYPVDPLRANIPKHNSNSRNFRSVEDESKFIPSKNMKDSVPTTQPDSTGNCLKFKEEGSRESIQSLDSSDLSMASEDAIVLMYNMDDESCEDDKRNKRSRMVNNVVGKIYKNQEVCDPRSIPIELEITLSETIQNINEQKDKKDNLVSQDRKSTDHQPKNGIENEHEDRTPVLTTSKSILSNPAQSSNDQRLEKPQSEVLPSVGNAGDMMIPTKSPATSKLSQEQKPETMIEEANSSGKETPKSAVRPRGSMMEYEENLAIIEEDEDGDSSTGDSAIGSAASADSESIAELNSSAVFNKVPQKSKQPIPMGTRTRSMAEKMGVPIRRMREYHLKHHTILFHWCSSISLFVFLKFL